MEKGVNTYYSSKKYLYQALCLQDHSCLQGLFLFCDRIFRITISLTIMVSENTTNRLVIQLPVHRTGGIRRVNYRCTREEEQWKVLETDWHQSEKNII